MILRRYPMNITQIKKKEFVFILVHTFGAEKLLCQAKEFFSPLSERVFSRGDGLARGQFVVHI